MFARSHLAFFVGLIGLGACTPAVGTDQVAVRFYPPPSKNQILQQRDEAACTRAANNYVRIYVECMQRLGYRAELIGQGGVPMSVSQLPQPPSMPSPQQQQQPIVARETPRPIPSEESLKYSRLLDRLVAEDSRSWALNQYDQGSMKIATVEQSANGKQTRVKGNYTYNNGRAGWVQAELIDGRLSCLHYWDRNDCRKPEQGLGKQLDEVARYQRLHPTTATGGSSRGTNSDGFGSIFGAGYTAHDRREQQMEEINRQRDVPLSRGDSQYENMNNPSSPQY
jgi:hypothetical protein